MGFAAGLAAGCLSTLLLVLFIVLLVYRLAEVHSSEPEPDRSAPLPREPEVPRACGFVPYPGNGAYGHWTCELPVRHRGRHRFSNYTIPRLPRFWHVRHLARCWRAERKLHRFARGHGQPTRVPMGYRRALYPATFNPRPIITQAHVQAVRDLNAE